jgi:hypothetical protein
MYKMVIILGVIFSLCSCSSNKKNINYAYQIQGINAYLGQDVASLFDTNGAPNTVKRLNNNQVMWIYYTNYRPLGGAELISYDNPPPNSTVTSCMVKIILENDIVKQVLTNCS